MVDDSRRFPTLPGHARRKAEGAEDSNATLREFFGPENERFVSVVAYMPEEFTCSGPA
jgi:hypothetical protein